MSDNIPPELIPNILARLPVDAVLRCTSVCKSWYSLITSPSFASSHLNLSSPNQEPRLLVYYALANHRSSYRVHRDSQTFDEIAQLYPPIYHHWQIIDSLNGLVCLYDPRERAIALWNPSIRKSLILPKPRVFSASKALISIGFGFIPSNNEYKVVWLSYLYEHEPRAEIYQLSTGSWRDLKLVDFSYANLFYQQAHYNGILHWCVRRLEKDSSTLLYYICSFDTKDEKFRALMLPSCIRHDDRAHYMPCTFRESLCVIGSSTDDRLCMVWVMKEYGVADSWEKLFIVDIEQHDLSCFLYVRYNGELLYRKNSKTPAGEQGLVSYDCNNNQSKNLQFPAIYAVSSVRTYVDSLVLIKTPNDVKIEEKSTEISKNMRGLLLNQTNKTGEGSKTQ